MGLVLIALAIIFIALAWHTGRRQFIWLGLGSIGVLLFIMIISFTTSVTVSS